MRRLLDFAVLLQLLGPGFALAQQAPPTSEPTPAEIFQTPWQGQVLPNTRKDSLEPSQADTSRPLQVLPSLPLDDGTNASGPSFLLTEIILRGNTVFSDAELQTVVAPYVGRAATTSTLFEVRNALTRHYVEAGYVSSGARIPDQTPNSGVVVIELVEARLSEIQVLDGSRLRPGFIKRRLGLEAGRPLDVRRLERRIRMLQETAQLARIDARIEPGPAPGLDRLVLGLTDAPPVWAQSEAGTLISPSLGGIAGRADVGLVSPSGLGDFGQLRVTLAEGLFDVDVFYSMPISAHDLQLGVRGRYSESEIVTDELNTDGIKTEFVSAGIELSQPIWRERNQRIDIGLLAEWRQGRTFLGGEPTSFSEGSDEGEFRITALRFYAAGRFQTEKQIVSAQSTVSVGVNLLNATLQPYGLEDGRFVSWLGQVQVLRQLGDLPLELLLRANAQVADDRLLPVERFSVGGRHSVRGFRENLFVRDNGASGSAELRWLLRRDLDGRRIFEVFAHGDVGHSWTSKRVGDIKTTIAGAGFGLRYSPKAWAHLELSYTARISERPSLLEKDLQDEGVYLQIRVGRF